MIFPKCFHLHELIIPWPFPSYPMQNKSFLYFYTAFDFQAHSSQSCSHLTHPFRVFGYSERDLSLIQHPSGVL